MSIRITVEQGINAYGGLMTLMEEKLPAKGARRISKIIRKLEAEVKEYETVRLALVKEYGELIPDTENYTLPKDKFEDFKAAIEPTLEDTMILEGVELLDEELLGNIQISPRVMDYIECVLVAEEVAPAAPLRAVESE